MTGYLDEMSAWDRLTALTAVRDDRTRWQPGSPIPPDDGVQWEPDAHNAFHDNHFDLPEVLSTGLQAVVWVGSAALSGVLGNAAHDLLKSIFTRRRERGALGEQDAALIARLAVFAACVDLDSWPSKIRYQQISVPAGRLDETTGVWQFRCTATIEPPVYFLAEVLPGDPPETRILMQI